MFSKVLRYDLKNGLLQEYKRYLWIVFVFAVMWLDYFLRSPAFRAMIPDADTTLGDYYAFTFLGMVEYIPAKGQPFRFPAIWMLILLLVLYIVLYYPYKDLMGFGRHVLVNARTRAAWWLSKCFWVILGVLIYFALYYAVIFLLCLLAGVTLSLTVSTSIFYAYVPPQLMAGQFAEQFLVELLVMPVLLAATLGLVQLTLSLIIKPFFSYCVSVAVLLVSAYYASPFLIGNYAMLLRSQRVVNNGVAWRSGIYMQLGIILFSVLLGLVIFRNFDVVDKRND